MAMKIAIVCRTASGRFDPEAGRGFGGMQVRASMFAHGLAQAKAHDVMLVVPNAPAARCDRLDGLRVVEWPHARDHPRLDRVTDRVRECVERSACFPWVRLRRWRWRLAWELPLAGWHHALFLGQLRRGYSSCVARAVSRLDAEVVCAFQPSRFAAAAVVGAHRRKRAAVTMIANDVDLGDHVYEHSRERGPNEVPGHACWRSIVEADEVVVQTKWQQQRLQERFGRCGVLIRNPIDLRPKADLTPPVTPPYALWIGRGDTHHKRPHKCFELARQCPAVRFVMIMNPVNDAQQARLKSQAPPNVHLIDRVPYEQIDSYFKHAAVFLSTSAFEGFPNTFLHAGKYSVPIISLAVDPDHFVETHDCGVVCGDDLQRMAAALEQMMSDPEMRHQRGRAAWEYVRHHHALEDRVNELDALLTSLAARKAG